MKMSPFTMKCRVPEDSLYNGINATHSRNSEKYENLSKAESEWFVYIVEARSGALYTGITNNLRRRFEKHSSGQGARYFRISAPVRIVYQEQLNSRSEATKREAEIKKYTRQQKLALISRKQDPDKNIISGFQENK